jgi:ABC-type multidrug transport system fused ATPase/permease subunit
MFWHAFVKDSLRVYAVLPRRLRLSFWFVFVLQIATAVTETLTLLVISLFAMSVASPEAAMNHFLVRPFMETFPSVADFCSTPRRMVAFTSSFMVMFVCLKSVLTLTTMYFTTLFSEKVANHVGREAIGRYLAKSYYWHISSRSGKVIHKIANRISLSALTVQLLTLYSNVICSSFLFASLFIAQPRLTLVVILCFAFSSLSLYAVIRHRIDRAGQLSSSTSIEENISVTAMTRGIREIVTYRQQRMALRKMMDAVERGLPARSFLNFCYTIPSVTMECVGFVTIGGMVIHMLSRQMPMEEIVAAASILMLTAWRILPAVTRSLGCSVAIRGIKPRALLCLDLLETFTRERVEPEVEPDPGFRFERSLALKGASFRYPDSAGDSIRDISLTILKGQNVGLIGPSGAGKSTLALVLSGLVAPTGGLFEVDGRVLDPASRASYLMRLGYVPQNPLLMDGTLADNVAFSRWGQDYDRGRVLEACRLAAMDFVARDPASLDLVLGGHGGSLSGGEAQRVAIARALFVSPEVIIFDEATSALDLANEGAIRNTIGRIRGRITSIIIAHRLSTVEDCDLLFWIDSGRLVTSGPPSEIIPLYQASLSDGEARAGGGDGPDGQRPGDGV